MRSVDIFRFRPLPANPALRGSPSKRRVMRQCCLIAPTAATLLVTLASACAAESGKRESAESPSRAAPQSPVPPEESLQYFQLHPDCRIELVACEPDVMSPIQVAFDPGGRMWVVEYTDYPHGPAEGEPGRCRIRILTDDNSDGRYENPRVFADKLLFATGLALWRDGVIVTSEGSVDFLRDTDGDGTADQRETWFRGFSRENPQLRANAPTFALDNHFYIASGLRGGEVIAVREGWSDHAQPVNLSSRDFRFDPLRGTYESVTGPSQFGITFDDWGNRFTCNNRNPCDHVVIEDWHVRRNPSVRLARATQEVSPSGETSRVYPISRFWTTSNLHEGQFTAACGICNSRAAGLPMRFYGSHFVCDPTGNLVHCDILTPRGASFSARPEREGVEFLASTDTWFRPVNLTVGPDGALYVVDMYRAVIEHPEWMPQELRERPDLLLGVDRGRIYRVLAKDATGESLGLRRRPLDKYSSPELVNILGHAVNGWLRDTTHRLLYERLTESEDAETVALLRRCAREAAIAPGRVHSLWLLHGLGQLDAATLDAALNQDEPRVVEQAVRIASECEPTPERARRIAEIAVTGGSTDGRLAFQCVLSLSAFPLTDEVIPRLAQAACHYGSDPWMVIAATITARDQGAAVLAEALRRAGRGSDVDATAAVVRGLAAQVGATVDARSADGLLACGADVPAAIYQQLVLGLADGVTRSGRSWPRFSEEFTEAVRQKLGALYSDAARHAVSDSAAAGEQLSILQLAPWDIARDPLLRLARGENMELRVAAVQALAGRSDPAIDALLLDDFAAQTPAVKPALLSAIFASSERIQKLLDAIEAGRIAPREVDVTRSDRLLNHPDAALRERAARLWSTGVSSDRQQVLADYRAALTLDADPRRGRDVFARHCIQCHRVGGLGVNVAPEISDVGRTQSLEQILLSILDPNRAIDNNYFSYSVLDHDGTVHTGVIAAETATSVTLRQAEGKEVTLLRSEIEELRSNGVSLMPVGVEKDINLQQMADLLSFIKNWRYLDGSVPGIGD